MFRGLWNTSKIKFWIFFFFPFQFVRIVTQNMIWIWGHIEATNLGHACIFLLLAPMSIVQFIQVYLLSQGLYDLNEANSARFIFRNMFFKVHYYVKIKIKVDTFFRVAIKWPHYLGILFSQRNLFKCHFLNITSKLTFNV